MKIFLVAFVVVIGTTMMPSSASATASATAAVGATAAMVVLPRMGLGMAALGRPGYINLDRSSVFDNEQEDTTKTTKDHAKQEQKRRSVERMQSQSDKVLDSLFAAASLAAKAGGGGGGTVIPWIDCARSYGLSEKFVGEYLRTNNIQPNQVYVSSKWGYTYVADWNVSLESGQPHEVKDHSVDNFLKQLEETNKELGPYLNLYQIHSATFESGVMDNVEVHKALVKCRSENGWKIGLSVSSPKQDEVIRRAIELEIDDMNEGGKTKVFDSIQCTYNVLEQRPGPALLEASQSGMDIIIKEGLANGRALKHPIIQKYAQKLGCEPDQLALGCILAQPFRPRVLSGAVTPEQLESNLKALKVAEQTLEEDTKLLEEIMDQTVMDSQDYWTERSNLSWN